MFDRKTVTQQLKLGIFTLMLLNFSPILFAGEKENNIIARAVEAYGGDKLTQLQNLKLTDSINHYYIGQSGHSAQGPMAMQLSKYNIEITLDLLSKHKVFKRAATRLVGSHGTDKPTVDHQIFVSGKGYSVDHGLQQYSFLKGINYNNVDAGFSQLLDPLIIKQLAKDKGSSHWTDTAYIQGQAHDVLMVNAGTKEEYSVYINQKNGYLARMLKKRGGELRTYDFMNYHHEQGITWAKQLFVSTAKQPVYYTDSRKLTFNLDQHHQFNIPIGYKQRQPSNYIDVSPLTIRQLAKGVYFVGKEWGYTLFIDAGSHYISAGSWQEESNTQAWLQGLALLRKTTGDDKPVKQHIVSHHHTDHMMGLSDIVGLGTNLVIHPINIPAVNHHLKKPLANSRFIPKEEISYLANGKVMLFDVPNSHASHNLVIYLPEHKLLFSEDMYGSGYQIELPSTNGWPNIDTYHRLDVLINKINQLGLEVEQYVSSHHARVLTQADIDKAIKLSRPSKVQLTKRLFAQHVNLNE